MGHPTATTFDAGVAPALPDVAVDVVSVPVAAALSVPNTPIDFGTVDVGGPAADQTFVVTNVGAGPAHTITLTPTAGLTATGCAAALPAMATCTVTVSWAPTAVGKLIGSVELSAGTATPVSVAVLGTAVLSADFSVSPVSIPLGNIEVGKPLLQTITVKNNKAIALPLIVGLSGQDITKDATSTCGASLAANGTCTVVVSFQATTNGMKSDAVSIGGNGVFKDVPMSATALYPAKLGASPTLVTFAAVVGQTDSKQIAVVNQGDLPTGIITATIAGTDFSVAGAPECLAPLAGAKYCTFTVTYSPKAVSTSTGTVTFTDPGATSVVVNLWASRSGLPGSTAAPEITGSGDFGNVLVGSASATATFTMTNYGGTASAPLTVTGPEGAFVKVSDTCTGASLATGATCTVGVQFRPTVAGTVDGWFSATVAGATGVKALEGTGIAGATADGGH